MKSEITLEHVGYLIAGESTITLWGGSQAKINIRKTHIPDGNLTKETLLCCVNDGEFGCASIDSADIEIYDVYGGNGHNNYSVYNRTVHIENTHNRHKFFCRGV